MDQFLSFIAHHWMLSSAFVLCILILVLLEIQGIAGGAKRLTPSESIHFMNDKDAVMFDLRSKESYQQGHVLGAKQIDKAHLLEKLPSLCPDKTKPIILCCETGQQTQTLAADLLKDNYTQTFVLAGGIKAWQEENLPLIRDAR